MPRYGDQFDFGDLVEWKSKAGQLLRGRIVDIDYEENTSQVQMSDGKPPVIVDLAKLKPATGDDYLSDIMSSSDRFHSSQGMTGNELGEGDTVSFETAYGSDYTGIVTNMKQGDDGLPMALVHVKNFEMLLQESGNQGAVVPPYVWVSTPQLTLITNNSEDDMLNIPTTNDESPDDEVCSLALTTEEVAEIRAAQRRTRNGPFYISNSVLLGEDPLDVVSIHDLVAEQDNKYKRDKKNAARALMETDEKIRDRENQRRLGLFPDPEDNEDNDLLPLPGQQD